MARAKNPETAKTPRTRKKVSPANGNGHVVPRDIESEIRIRAYEIYVQRGDTRGTEFDDWLTAEKEVKSKRASAGA